MSNKQVSHITKKSFVFITQMDNLGQVRRTDYTVHLCNTKYQYYLYCLELNSEWVWRYRPMTDVRYIGDLPVLKDTTCMSEEELFQYSLVWDSVWGSDDMDFDAICAIQKSDSEFRKHWIPAGPLRLEVQ